MALNAGDIASIKESIINTVIGRLPRKQNPNPSIGQYHPENEGFVVDPPPLGESIIKLEDEDDIKTLVRIIVEEVCDQLSDSIVNHFKQAAQVNIITGILANGGSTSGFGGPGAGLMVTGTCAVPNTIT